MIVTRSRHAYADTLDLLSAAIVAADNTVFATIDQSAAATSVGLQLRPTSLIVWEDRGEVSVVYVPMSEVARRYELTGAEARIATMDRALATLVDTVKARSKP